MLTAFYQGSRRTKLTEKVAVFLDNLGAACITNPMAAWEESVGSYSCGFNSGARAQ